MRIGELPIMAAKEASGIGTPIFVADATEIKIHLDVNAAGDGTIKFQGSDTDALPTFSSAQSPTNKWDYVEVIDNEDGASIDGDTGVTLAGAAANQNFTVNVDALTWLCARLTTYTAGEWTVTATQYNESR